jgi:RNA polymerase subunit RPABC4/transcription elongation factor Spt4
LKVNKPILLLPSIGVIFAGIILCISPFMGIFAYRSLGTITGIIFLLLFTMVGIWEVFLFRAIGGTQVGEWPGIMKTLTVAMLLRLVILLSMRDVMLVLNLVALGIEGSALFIIYLNHQAFMPTEEEILATTRRFSQASVKTVAKCPKCSAVVEADWTLCPDCGTRLPRFCAKCGTEIKEDEQVCSNCGTRLEVPISLINMVDTLRKTAEMDDAAPETRSARYARLGEGLLKIGRLEEAIEAFRTAIHYTQFDRKRTNFMVKMAVVMANKGLMEEAEKLLDAAQQLDPEDVAGACKVREGLYQNSASPA